MIPLERDLIHLTKMTLSKLTLLFTSYFIMVIYYPIYEKTY